MVNKCVAFGCSSGYHANREKVSTFSFPLGKSNLLEKWMKFVNCNEWFPMKNSVLCIKHFDEKFILGGKRNKLNWDLHPIPTIHSEKNKKTISFADYNRIKKAIETPMDYSSIR